MAPTKRGNNDNVVDLRDIADLTGPHPVFETGREDLPEDLKVKYDVVLASLAGDAREKLGFGFLEQMMCERLALLHCLGLERARRGIGVPNPSAAVPQDPGFADYKEYSDFQKMWFDLAAKLQRAQAQTVSVYQQIEQERTRLIKQFGDHIDRIITSDEYAIPSGDRDKMIDAVGEMFDIIQARGRS